MPQQEAEAQLPPSPRPTQVLPPTWTPAPTETPAPTRTPRPTSRNGSGFSLGSPSTPTSSAEGTALAPPVAPKIVFAASDNPDWKNIYTVYEDGTWLTQHTYEEGVQHLWPTLSPDGEQIAFVSDREGDTLDIYVMSADGSNIRRLTESDAEEGWPAWSPDGQQILYSEEGEDGARDLYVMDASGSEPTVLTAESDLIPFHPAWSPDGEEIAFAGSISETMAIFIMNADGSEMRQLTPEDQWFTNPVWSPDGEQLLLRSDPEENRIYLIAADGSNLRALSTNPRGAMGATWSPDGQKIALVGPADNNDLIKQIFVYNVRERELVQVTSFPAENRWFIDIGNWAGPEE